jgi:hypothetical protein
VAEESPFANFVPSSEPPTAEAPKNAAKKSRKNKSTKPAAESAAPKLTKVAAATPAKPKKARKPRQSHIFKIGIGAAIIALAGLTTEDIELLKQVAAGLVDAPKKQRQRVAAAIAKIFA